MHYKDPEAPEKTKCGECTVEIFAFYTAPGSEEAQASTNLTYDIQDGFTPLELKLDAPQTYVVISEMGEMEPVTAKLLFDGQELTAEQMERVDLTVESELGYTATIQKDKSSYEIRLVPGEKLAEGKFPMVVKATYADELGRTTDADDKVSFTLSNTPLWVKWLIGSLLLLLLLAIILIIMHIKVMPMRAHAVKRDCSMNFDGEDVTTNTSFDVKVSKGNMTIRSKYGGAWTGVTMEAKPGKESYLKKPHTRRYAEIRSASVKKHGSATVQEVSFGAIKYVMNEDTKKFERVPPSDKPFDLRHNAAVSYSGIMKSAGEDKPFTARIKLNYKKKK